MAFLDNSGDIILDAVLTDTGRMRLAKGDGSFRVVKFALSDDEIDYELFNKSHPSGSAYYDLEIMQTPILEAFTNNTSTMKHKLMSMPQTNLIYLPSMRLNNQVSGTESALIAFQAGSSSIVDGITAADAAEGGVFMVAVDKSTYDAAGARPGLIAGSFEQEQQGKSIRVDQGLNTSAISSQSPLSSELRETQYIVRLDSRFLSLAPVGSNEPAKVSFIDDDSVATYYLSLNTDTNYVENMSSDETESVISGPKGSSIKFSLLSSLDLETSSHMFTTLGGSSSMQITTGSTANNYYYIDTNVRVTGATTGSTVDIPVRLMKHYT